MVPNSSNGGDAVMSIGDRMFDATIQCQLKLQMAPVCQPYRDPLVAKPWSTRVSGSRDILQGAPHKG